MRAESNSNLTYDTFFKASCVEAKNEKEFVIESVLNQKIKKTDFNEENYNLRLRPYLKPLHRLSNSL